MGAFMKFNKKFVVLIAALFLLTSTICYAKGGGSSSFSSGGGGKSSSSGFSSSKSSSSPSTSSSPSKSTSPGFTNSSGAKASVPAAPTETNKSSAFSSGVNSGVNNQPAPKPPVTSSSQPFPSPSVGYSQNRSVTRVYIAPPTYYPSYVYMGGYTPAANMINLWYQMEMLKTIQDVNERQRIMMEMKSDPNYNKWKSEAAAQAAENKILKEELDKVNFGIEKLPVQPTVVNKTSSFAWFGIVVLVLILFFVGITVYRRKF